jgi:hypothetical protein
MDPGGVMNESLQRIIRELDGVDKVKPDGQ